MNNADNQKLSDLLLAAIALAVGAGVLWSGAGSLAEEWDRTGGYFFPALVALGLVAIGVVLLLRAWFAPPPPARWSIKGVAAVAVAVIVIVLGGTWFAPELIISFGPPEFAAFFILLIAAAILIARRSRARATAMALFGLLLAAVGLDVVTGQLRLTLGYERLFDGIDVSLAQAGLILVGDALLALVSPALWFASLKWLEGSWQDRPPAGVFDVLVRAAAVVAIVASCFYAYALSHDALDIGLLFAFGVFGVASKLLGWNRPVLIVAFVFSSLLEQSIRQVLLMTQGDLTPLFGRSISGVLLLAVAAVAALAIFLSLRRTLSGRGVQAA